MSIRALLGVYEFEAALVEVDHDYDPPAYSARPSAIVTVYLPSGETDVVTLDTAIVDLQVAWGWSSARVQETIERRLRAAAEDEDEADHADALLQRAETR